MKNKWWEKTVEYCFVLKYLEELSAMPLDGNEEKVGDILLANKDTKIIIIEFKRDKDTLSSEKSKFNNWEDSTQKIKETYPESDFHLLCFGSLEKEKKVLELKFSNYWNLDLVSSQDQNTQKERENNGETVLVSIQDQNTLKEYINNNGKTFEELKSYISNLDNLKKGKNGSSGGGIIDSLENCLIVGMDTHNNLTATSLKEYQEFRKENKITNNTPKSSQTYRPK